MTVVSASFKITLAGKDRVEEFIHFPPFLSLNGVNISFCLIILPAKSACTGMVYELRATTGPEVEQEQCQWSAVRQR